MSGGDKKVFMCVYGQGWKYRSDQTDAFYCRVNETHFPQTPNIYSELDIEVIKHLCLGESYNLVTSEGGETRLHSVIRVS